MSLHFCHTYTEISTFLMLGLRLTFKTIRKQHVLSAFLSLAWNLRFLVSIKNAIKNAFVLLVNVVKYSSGREVHTYTEKPMILTRLRDQIAVINPKV